MSLKAAGIAFAIGASLAPSMGATFKSIRAKAEGVKKVLNEAQKKKTTTDKVIKYRNLIQDLEKKQTKLGRSSKRLDQGLEEVRKRYRQAKQEAKKYGIQIGDAAREQKRLTRQIKRSEQALKGLAKRKANQSLRRNLRSRAIDVFGGAYAIGATFRNAMAEEQAEVRLRTVINSGDVGKSLEEARQHAFEFAQSTLATKTEMLDINYALNSAGLEAEAARMGAEIVHKVATVTGGMPERVGEVVATTFNNLGHQLEGSTQEKMTRIGDLLTKVQFKFQIRDFSQLGESMKYAVDPINRFNVDLEQGVTLIGQLNSAGLQGSMAGTAFGAAMRNMSKAADEFGIEMVENEKGQLDMIATLEQLREELGDPGEWDQATRDRLGNVFGDEGARAITPLLINLDKVKTAQEDVSKGSRGVVDESYKHFNESAAGQWQKTATNIKAIGTAFATSLLPGLKALTDFAAPIAGFVANTINRFPIIGQVVGGLGAGVVGFTAVLMAGRYAWSLFSDALQVGKGIVQGAWSTFIRTRMLVGRMGTSFKLAAIRAKAFSGLQSVGSTLMGFARTAVPAVIAGIKTLNLAMLTSPVGLIIGGIALAVGLIIAYWKPIKEFFLKIWEPIKPVWEKFVGWIAKYVNILLAPFKAVGKAVGWIFKKLGLGGKDGVQEEDLSKAPKPGDAIARAGTGPGMDNEDPVPTPGSSWIDRAPGGVIAETDPGADTQYPGLPIPQTPGAENGYPGLPTPAQMQIPNVSADLPPIQITISAPNDIKVGGVDQLVQALESGQGRLVEAVKNAVNDAVSKSRRASFAAS